MISQPSIEMSPLFARIHGVLFEVLFTNLESVILIDDLSHVTAPEGDPTLLLINSQLEMLRFDFSA